MGEMKVSFGMPVKMRPNEWEFISKLLCLLSNSINSMRPDRTCAVTITDNVLTQLGCNSVKTLSHCIEHVRPMLVKGRVFYRSDTMHGDFKKAFCKHGFEIGTAWILNRLEICDCGTFKHIKAEFNPEYIRWSVYMTGRFLRNIVDEIRIYDYVGEVKE